MGERGGAGRGGAGRGGACVEDTFGGERGGACVEDMVEVAGEWWKAL